MGLFYIFHLVHSWIFFPICSWYVAFINHSPIGDSHLKILKNSFWKDARKNCYILILIPWYLQYFTLWKFFFRDSLCCNFFIRFDTTRFFIRNTRLNLTKNQAKVKQHSEAELLLFENHSLFSSILSSKK